LIIAGAAAFSGGAVVSGSGLGLHAANKLPAPAAANCVNFRRLMVFMETPFGKGMGAEGISAKPSQ
jgi:hypothetical protein